MKQSESIKELATALATFQGEITSVNKDSVNPFFKMKYASLNSIWEHIREPLSKYGLSVIQGGEPDLSDNHVVINTLLLHASGEWILSSLPIKPVKDDPQGIGSAITYARRYGLSAILGLVADEDDDGEVAQARQTEKYEKKTPPKQAPQPEATKSKSSPVKEGFNLMAQVRAVRPALKTDKNVRDWLVVSLRIEDERIDNEPEVVWAEVQEML